MVKGNAKKITTIKNIGWEVASVRRIHNNSDQIPTVSQLIMEI